jgi:hypothetical protein
MQHVLRASCLLAALILPACGDTRDAPPAAPAAGPVEAPADGGISEADGAGAQDTPQAAALEFYRLVGDARFGDACRLLAPATQQAFLRAGKDCATEIADNADADARTELRADLKTVTIDESKVELAGDTAEIPNDAWIVPGKDEYDHSFNAVALVKQAGGWYLVSE